MAADETPAPALARAGVSARVAGASLSKVQRWLREVALKKIDPRTGLYVADGHWNYRDTAADCYPFFVWAAWAVDREILNGPARAVLHAEQRLCNQVGRIPVPYDWRAGKPQTAIAHDEMVFQASEYVKDGLIAIVEVTGPDEWFQRMRAIEDDLWRGARIKTPFGKIPSKNIEVNGEQIQALVRLYTMTGEPCYLDWAERIADYYLADPAFVPNRLRDHGCEIIGGLGLLLGIESEHRPDRAAKYAARLKRLFDTILTEGCNADGMMYNEIRRRAFGDRARAFSDGWGYNYVAYLCYDWATGRPAYEARVRRVLRALAKPGYRDYPWEGTSIDGWADSVEGALYLLNRLPVPEGFAWVEHETAAHIARTAEPDHLWGTMKLEANGVRTVLIHALMHTRGLTAHPWQPGLELGAATDAAGTLFVVLRSAQDYAGRLEFDIPRHRIHLGFQKDWPRMNTLPEWFTVEPERKYAVRALPEGPVRMYTGQQLHNGLAVAVQAGGALRLEVARR